MANCFNMHMKELFKKVLILFVVEYLEVYKVCTPCFCSVKEINNNILSVVLLFLLLICLLLLLG